MAGSSTNWMKAPKGSIKKRLFVSNAALLGWANEIGMGDLSVADIKKTFAKRADSLAPTILDLSGRSVQPGGQAKAKGSDVPDGWASEPEAQALIRRQAIPGGMRVPGAEEQAFREAYAKANPLVATRDDFEEWGDVPAGLKALAGYVGPAYRPINDLMWESTANADGSLTMSGGRDEIAPLQQLLLSSRAPFDMTVTRAAGNMHPLFEWAQGAEVGASYLNKGFDSSSLNPEISGVSGNKLKLRMRIPKGSRGASVNHLTGVVTSEQEWLIPANGSWVVTGKTVGETGVIELTVDLVEQRDFSGKIVYP